MRAALAVFLLLAATHPPALAQPSGRGNTWYFGQNAGLAFGPGGAQALTDGRLTAAGGCASVSDTAGHLLFYTDGNAIFNRNHQPMPGATDLNGGSAPAVVIAPYPNHSWMFYVFWVGGGGVQYARVDMTLANGLGGLLGAPQTLVPNATEHLTLVPHCNKSNFWVITHERGTDAFRVFLINDLGLVPTPRVSNVGSAYRPGQERGCLKPTASGRRLAAAVSGPGEPGLVEVFDFNDKTGSLTSARTRRSADFAGAYGVEFSPDGNRLYLSAGTTLHQLDAGSLATLGTFSSTVELGALQGGPDGRLYAARVGAGHLGVLANPNAGAGWSERGFFLAGKTAGRGLPFAYLQTPILPPGLRIARRDGPACNEFLLTSEPVNLDPNHLVYLWYRNGRAVEGATQPTLRPTRAGTYQLKVRETECLDRTVLSNEIEVPIVELDPLATPTGCGTVQLAARASVPVRWSGPGLTPAQAALDSFALTGPPGGHAYRVRATSPLDAGCFLEKTVSVVFDVPPPYRLDSAQRTACGDRLAVDLRPTPDWDAFRWTAPDGTTHQGTTLTATQSGRYRITALSRRTACESSADLTVTLNPVPTIALSQSEIRVCFDETPRLDLTADATGADAFEWTKNGLPLGSAPVLGVRDYGRYDLRAKTAAGCEARDSVRVASNCPLPPLRLVLPDVFTPNGDGVNDAFRLRGTSVEQYDLRIVNRWGEVVYQAEGGPLPPAGLDTWDGTFRGSRVPPGSYAYQVRVSGPALGAGEWFTKRGVVWVAW